MLTVGVVPFSCGTQKMDWKARNCERCRKGYDEDGREWRCEVERAIDEASLAHGRLPEAMASRMGYGPTTALSLTWDCPERGICGLG